MEFILSLPVIGTLLTVIAPFILVLGIVIFVHEYGHYYVGRLGGIHPEAFSIGFGPEIFGWTDTRGTRWKVCWIPLGGYVRFKGDADAASRPDAGALDGMDAAERRTTLQGAPLGARAAMVLAGPMANFLLTIVLMTGLALVAGRASEAPVIGDVTPTGQAYGAGLRAGDVILSVDGAPIETFSAFQAAMLAEEGAPRRVEIQRGDAVEMLDMSFSRPTRVRAVSPGSPAEAACLKPNDVIQKIDGRTIASFSDLQSAVTASDGAPLAVTVQRGSELKELVITPRVIEQPDPVTGDVTRRLMIGVSADVNLGWEAERRAVGVGEALLIGLEAPLRVARATFGYLGAIFAGRSDGSSLGGPIGIADASGRAADAGFIQFVAFIATISTAIGLINLFPIPILDGGHLTLYAVEAVRGRPLSDKTVEAVMTVGLVAILALMVFVTSNDVSRLAPALIANC